MWALVEIERFTGTPPPPVPEDVRVSDVEHIAWLGQVLRDGGYSIRLTSMTARVGPQGAGAFRTGSDITLSETLVGDIFGHEVVLAERITRLPLMAVNERRRLPGEDAWAVVLVPLHSDEVEVWSELRPLDGSRESDGHPGQSGTAELRDG